MEEWEKIKERDNLKTKILKYIMYKKRTENEVKAKFRNEQQEQVEEIIEELKENGYLNDENYIKRSIQEYMNLKNMSIKEIKYKLLAKGISKNILEEYIYNNSEELKEYERKSAKTIWLKKQFHMEQEEIKNYLIKKGYQEDSIRNIEN